MGATNHTTNYNLPQFVGSDKPTWLGDVNGAMNSIDAQMKSNFDLGTLAKTTADTANTTATSASATAQSASATATTAETTATTALTKALKNEANIENLNLTIINNLSFTHTGNGSVTPRTNSPLKIAKNSDGSLCKIYGVFRLQGFGSETITLTSGDTGLRPSQDIAISPAGFRFFVYSSGQSMNDIGFTIKTTGEIEIKVAYDGGFSYQDIYLFPFLIYVKDFGDVIPPEN